MGLYVLLVAKKARKAAEEARDLAKQRNLVEQLEGASERIRQMGIFARSRQCDILHLRASEVLSSCNEIAMRWPDHLGSEGKDDVMKARTQVRSIADVISQVGPGAPNDRQWIRISRAQLEASTLISGVLGSARKRSDGGTEND